MALYKSVYYYYPTQHMATWHTALDGLQKRREIVTTMLRKFRQLRRNSFCSNYGLVPWIFLNVALSLIQTT